MKALKIYAGTAAYEHIKSFGLSAEDIYLIAGAAGGPKGLVLTSLDRFIFHRWLARSPHPIDLLGASIGAWRLATAMLPEAANAFEQLEEAYRSQNYVPLKPGGRVTPDIVTSHFDKTLKNFFEGRMHEVLENKKYRLHIVTSRGLHILHRDNSVRTPLGYLGLYLSNAVSRKGMELWTERVIFSSPSAALGLNFNLNDFRTRRIDLNQNNFHQALLASCSIPFVLRAVHDIPEAPKGAYWDGGITDYHLHWDYESMNLPAYAHQMHDTQKKKLVLYPHFQKELVPGWFDKAFKSRHQATSKLTNVILLAPNKAWSRTLPNNKLPDRTDFKRYGSDWKRRSADWHIAIEKSRELRDEFSNWLESGCSIKDVELL